MSSFERYKKAISVSGKFRNNRVWTMHFARGTASALDIFGVNRPKVTFGSPAQDFRALESDMEAISQDFSLAFKKTAA